MAAYNWDIIWSFLFVFGLFWLSNMGDFSLWYSWAYGWKISCKIWPWKKARFQGWLKLANFLISQFSDFWPYLPSKLWKCKKLGMRWKIQEICSKMGTNFFEIDEEMSEISDAKVGNPQNSTSKKWANFSQPWNLAIFQDYIFKKYVHF